MRKVRFGTRIPASGPASSSERVLDSTREAEALGFDAVFVMDHIHNGFERHKQYPVGMGSHRDRENTLEPHQFEAVTTFAFLAGATSKIEFGVGVMALPLRDPIILGKELGTLDALSGGRFIFGVGVSNASDKEEYRAVGRPYLPYVERYRMVGEYIAAMRAIWEQPTASFHGAYVNFDDLVVYPKPARRIPVWVGALDLSRGPEHPAVRFALDHADGWMFGFLTEPGSLRSKIDDFKTTAAETGRDLSDFDVCFQLRLSIGETREEAQANAHWIVEEQTDMARHAGYMLDLEDAAPWSNIETAVIGTPADVQARIREFIDAGATYFDLWFMYPTYDALQQQLRLFATEVVPAFRQAPAAVLGGR